MTRAGEVGMEVKRMGKKGRKKCSAGDEGDEGVARIPRPNQIDSGVLEPNQDVTEKEDNNGLYTLHQSSTPWYRE